MKKWFVLAVFFLAFQINAHAINLDSYMDNTGNYAYQTVIGFREYFQNGTLGQFIGGPASGANTANAFQFTVSQPLTITDLSINATAFNNFNNNNNAVLPITFQIFGSSTSGPGGTGIIPDTQSLLFNSLSTTFQSNGINNNVYVSQNVPFNVTLQQGTTYWFADEITPPVNGGALVKLQSVDFMGKVATPEPATWLFFGFGMLLVSFKAFHSRRKLVRVTKNVNY